MPLRPSDLALRIRPTRAPAALLCLLLGGAAPPPVPLPTPAPAAAGQTVSGCEPSLQERERLLAQGVASFDRGGSGWRVYGDAHCYSEAAGLIADYVDGRGPTLTADDEALLRFHAAQMLANANRADDAAGQLAQVLALEPRRASPDQGWRLYVQGTLGFLRGDRSALDGAAHDLKTYADAEAGPVQAGDRLNLNALHGLQRCFGRGYAFAYGSPDCRDFDEARRLNAEIG